MIPEERVSCAAPVRRMTEQDLASQLALVASRAGDAWKPLRDELVAIILQYAEEKRVLQAEVSRLRDTLTSAALVIEDALAVGSVRYEPDPRYFAVMEPWAGLRRGLKNLRAALDEGGAE